MNTAIVPANFNTFARSSIAANTSTPPTPRLKGQSFATVYEAVMARADAMLPDRVVHVADLKMNPAGHIVVPDGNELRMNDWARKQLSSMLGLRWDRWFKSASGEERAEEVSRRFSRTPGEIKLRAWKDDDGVADGILRAVLSASFAPIADARIFTSMNTMLRGLVEEYRFTSVEFTDSTTHYTAVHTEAFDLDGDRLHPGWHLRNSEVGASALSLDDHWLRLVCLNGLLDSQKSGGRRPASEQNSGRVQRTTGCGQRTTSIAQRAANSVR